MCILGGLSLVFVQTSTIVSNSMLTGTDEAGEWPGGIPDGIIAPLRGFLLDFQTFKMV